MDWTADQQVEISILHLGCFQRRALAKHHSFLQNMEKARVHNHLNMIDMMKAYTMTGFRNREVNKTK
jgi:hypothetical protein